MDSSTRLLMRPVSWSTLYPSTSEIEKDPSLFPSIEVFGYTSDGRSIYLRILHKSTFIFKFKNDVTDETIYNLDNPEDIKISTIDPKVMIIRSNQVPEVIKAEARSFDPYGELASFWEAKEIGPYEWLSINKYSPLYGKYTTCDFNMKTEEDYISVADDSFDIPLKLFFWDIETYSPTLGKFPSSNNPDDVITMISIITFSREGRKGYVITKGNINVDLINVQQDDLTIIKANNEKDLLIKFFALYNNFQPDRQIYYNGDSYDMPYLLNRLTYHNLKIPKISKIVSLTPNTKYHNYQGYCGKTTSLTLNLPDSEIIDLFHFYKRFYPHLRNNKLDTVAKTFLGLGKTGLTIDEMMKAVKDDSHEKLIKVLEYSFIDSLRLFQLWEVNNIQNNLELISNNLGVSVDVLLRNSFESIIERIVYNIDAGTVFIKPTFKSSLNLIEPKKGMYRNVYIYDYTELYLEVMLASDDLLTVTLANRLEGAPPKLIMLAFYSSYVDKVKLLPILNDNIDKLVKTKLILSLDDLTIKSLGPLNSNKLVLVDIIPYFISLTKSSYLTINESGELESTGTATLCRPKFPLIADIIKEYIKGVDKFVLPILQEQEIDKLAITDKLNNSCSNAIKSKLSSQCETNVDTWLSVKYIMTTDGPILLSSFSQEKFKIDYNYYQGEINKYLTLLQALNK